MRPHPPALWPVRSLSPQCHTARHVHGSVHSCPSIPGLSRSIAFIRFHNKLTTSSHGTAASSRLALTGFVKSFSKDKMSRWRFLCLALCEAALSRSCAGRGLGWLDRSPNVQLNSIVSHHSRPGISPPLRSGQTMTDTETASLFCYGCPILSCIGKFNPIVSCGARSPHLR